MKKHGILWWLFIGWWWAPIVLIIRLMVAVVKGATKKVGSAAPAAQAFPRVSTPVQKPATPQPSASPKPAQKTETHKVAGVSFRQEELRGLLIENDTYSESKRELQEAGYVDEWIYEHDMRSALAELVPEPENPHDPKAIKVVVDGTHIGYIKAGSCAHIHNLLRADKIDKVYCEIGGGRRKMLVSDYDDETDRDVFTVEKDSIPFYAKLEIVLKPEN